MHREATKSLIAREIESASNGRRNGISHEVTDELAATLRFMRINRRKFLSISAAASLAPSAVIAATRSRIDKPSAHLLQMNGYAVNAETPLEKARDGVEVDREDDRQEDDDQHVDRADQEGHNNDGEENPA